MKLDVAKNAIRTSFYGVINKFLMIILPFIVRTVMIREIGAEYLGLSGLFTSVLQVLNLTELGFGNAMVYSMYKPIAENDTELICSLLNFYKKVYRIMGIIIFIIGLILYHFLDIFVSGNIPKDININWLFLIYLTNSVSGYWLFAYKSSLFYAHQRYDIYNNIQTILNFINYFYQIIVLILFKNYYVYIITLPLVSIALNIVSAIIAEKKYPNYVAKGKLEKYIKQDIEKRVVALAGHKIGGVLSNSFDNIVISSFLGLTSLAIYNNYYYIISSLNGFMIIVVNALTAGIGNQIINYSKEKVYKNFLQVSCAIAFVAGWCSVCVMCLAQPFIKLWVGEDLMLRTDSVVYLCVYFYIWTTRYIISIYKDANGLWKADVCKPYIEGALNLTVNIILVKNLGVNGVMISTIISMLLVGVPWETHVLFKDYFIISMKEYIIKRVIYVVITLVSGIPTYIICQMIKMNGLICLILKIVCCFGISSILFIGISYFFLPEFRNIIDYFKRMRHFIT